MAIKTLIIHGWSDVSSSFLKIKDFLAANHADIAGDVYFVDYESEEDDMTYNDIANGLNDKLLALKLIDEKGKAADGDEFNVIVHSTGGLVFRHWLTTYYSEKLSSCPVKRVVMLAPANFGSPLAKDGKSFLGAIVAGRKKVSDIADFLETGEQILDGLELGSPFQWNLAHRDLLSELDFYSANSIQTTILVGIEDYKEFLRSFANKPGTDGTVVISGTQLDSVKFTLNFSDAKYTWSQQQTISSTAFGVVQKVNHSTIVAAASQQGTDVASYLVSGLQKKSTDEFTAYQETLKNVTETTYTASGKPQYEQFLIHVVDEFGQSIPDFTLEFFVCKKSSLEQKTATATSASWDEGWGKDSRLNDLSDAVSRQICFQFEKFSKDPSYRRFLVDVDKLRNTLAEVGVKESDRKATPEDPLALCMKIWVPTTDDGIRYRLEDLKSLVIYDSITAAAPIEDFAPGKPRKPALFYPNTTTLVELQVNRFTQYVWVSPQPMTKDDRKKVEGELANQ